jgi:hypothetical protein
MVAIYPEIGCLPLAPDPDRLWAAQEKEATWIQVASSIVTGTGG